MLGLIAEGLQFVREMLRPSPVKADHYFPVFPSKWRPPLRPGQCANCLQWYPAPLPTSGCQGRPVTTQELS